MSPRLAVLAATLLAITGCAAGPDGLEVASPPDRADADSGPAAAPPPLTRYALPTPGAATPAQTALTPPAPPDPAGATDGSGPATQGDASHDRRAQKPSVTPPAAPSPRRVARLRAAELASAGARAVRARLGEPRLRHVAGQIEVWQYRGERCVLDFHLAREDGGAAQVVHQEARDRHGNDVTVEACLADVMAASRANRPAI